MAVDPVMEWQIVATYGEHGDFESVQGGIPASVYTEHYEAGVRFPQYVQGTHAYSDMVLERAYKPDRDSRLFDMDAQNRLGIPQIRPVTIKIFNNLGIVQNTFVHPICKLVSIDRPSGQSGSSTIAKVRVTLKVEGQI